MKFREWFVEQFGERPSDKDIIELWWDANSLKNKYVKGELLFKQAKEWDDKFNNCLYAWNAAKGEGNETS